MIVNHEDLSLVKRLLAREERAFQVFFDRYFPRLFRFALSRIDQNPDAAEEIVQTTMCKVIDKLKTYRGEAAFFSWMCTFCRREISAYWKRCGRMQREAVPLEDTPEIRAALESLAIDTGDQAALLERAEVRRLVQVTLDCLKPRHREVLELKYLRGLSVKQIAASLGLGAKAIESLLTRARQAFRDGFQSMGAEWVRGRWKKGTFL